MMKKGLVKNGSSCCQGHKRKDQPDSFRKIVPVMGHERHYTGTDTKGGQDGTNHKGSLYKRLLVFLHKVFV
jgi:hypothetical protein